MPEVLSLFGADELPLQLKPPAYFKRLPLRLETEFCCPKCTYAWAGNPKPNVEEVDLETSEDAAAAA